MTTKYYIIRQISSNFASTQFNEIKFFCGIGIWSFRTFLREIQKKFTWSCQKFLTFSVFRRLFWISSQKCSNLRKGMNKKSRLVGEVSQRIKSREHCWVFGSLQNFPHSHSRLPSKLAQVEFNAFWIQLFQSYSLLYGYPLLVLKVKVNSLKSCS